jgi:hypothetical protein
MTYREAFDHLGNPIARPRRQPIGHTVLQVAGLIATIVGLCMLAWYKP